MRGCIDGAHVVPVVFRLLEARVQCVTAYLDAPAPCSQAMKERELRMKTKEEQRQARSLEVKALTSSVSLRGEQLQHMGLALLELYGADTGFQLCNGAHLRPNSTSTTSILHKTSGDPQYWTEVGFEPPECAIS